MGIRIKYPDGREEFLPTAVGEKEDAEGNLVFMDHHGKIVKVIEDEEGLQWHPSNDEILSQLYSHLSLMS